MALSDVLTPPPNKPVPAKSLSGVRSARLTLRQPVEPSGYIDGGWWPYSGDLTVEVPLLLDVFWTAKREMVHVSYNIDTWGLAPRRIHVDGRQVRLAGFHGQNPLTVFLSDSRHTDTAELLLITSDTDPAAAHRALELAGASGGTDRAEQMLAHAQTDAGAA